ncbi:MAG: replication-relaxation family protein [Bacilli bacterium]
MKTPSTIEREVLLALYRYTMLTTKQMSLILHYHPRNVQITLCTLRQEHWATPMQLSFLERNVKGWILSKSGLEMALGLTKEQRPSLLRRAGQSFTQAEHLYGSNHFFSSLIAESLARPKSEGLIEWIGMRDGGERYAVTDNKGKRLMPIRPDGIGTYRFANGTSTVFHVEYDTGSERLWVIHDKLTQCAEHLPKFWRNPAWTSVLCSSRVTRTVWPVSCMCGKICKRKQSRECPYRK